MKKKVELTVQTTTNCNNSCEYCYLGKYDEKNEITIEKMDQILRAYEERLKSVLILGGEVLTNPKHTNKILKKILEYKINPTIVSNGNNYDKMKIALEDLGPDDIKKITVSINAKIANIHDKMHGKKGAFEKAAMTLLQLHEQGYNMRIQTTILPVNYTSIIDMIEYFYNKGIHNFGLHGGSLEGIKGSGENDHVDRVAHRALIDKIKKDFSGLNITSPLLFATEEELKELGNSIVCPNLDKEYIYIFPDGKESMCQPASASVWYDPQIGFEGAIIDGKSIQYGTQMKYLTTGMKQMYPCPIIPDAVGKKGHIIQSNITGEIARALCRFRPTQNFETPETIAGKDFSIHYPKCHDLYATGKNFHPLIKKENTEEIILKEIEKNWGYIEKKALKITNSGAKVLEVEGEKEKLFVKIVPEKSKGEVFFAKKINEITENGDRKNFFYGQVGNEFFYAKKKVNIEKLKTTEDLKACGKLLAQIHSHKLRGFGEIVDFNKETCKHETLESMINEKIEILMKKHGKSPEIQKVLNQIKSTIPRLELTEDSCLTHGDLYTSNNIGKVNGNIYCFDARNESGMPPERDLAHLYFQATRIDQETNEEREKYNTITQEYCKESNRNLNNNIIKLYSYILGAQIYANTKKTKKYKATLEEIGKQVSHISKKKIPNAENFAEKFKEHSRRDRKKFALKNAFQMTDNGYAGIKRLNGKPYLRHMLNVVDNISKLNEPTFEQVITGLLHDNKEDLKNFNEVQYSRLFGEKIVENINRMTEKNRKDFLHFFGNEEKKNLENICKELRRYELLQRQLPEELVPVKFCDRIEGTESLHPDLKKALCTIFENRFFFLGDNANKIKEKISKYTINGGPRTHRDILEEETEKAKKKIKNKYNEKKDFEERIGEGYKIYKEKVTLIERIYNKIENGDEKIIKQYKKINDTWDSWQEEILNSNSGSIL